jgi:hypothetical protein
MEEGMAKATMTLEGATVVVEGSQDEVAALLARFQGRPQPQTGGPVRKPKLGPMSLLHELIADGFFREPKELGAVRAALAEKGHFYPVTSLSPLMVRLVRRKELRRLKEKNRWMYVS